MPGIGGMLHHDGIRALAAHFHDNGFATLMADLLTSDEQQFDARTRTFKSTPPLPARKEQLRPRNDVPSYACSSSRYDPELVEALADQLLQPRGAAGVGVRRLSDGIGNVAARIEAARFLRGHGDRGDDDV